MEKFEKLVEMNLCGKDDLLLCVDQQDYCECGLQKKGFVYRSECDRVFHCGYVSPGRRLLIEKSLF